MTRFGPSVIVFVIREFFSNADKSEEESKKDKETIMSLTIENLIRSEFDKQNASNKAEFNNINRYFAVKNPSVEGSKDGIVNILVSHFEKGGIVNTIQEDVSTLKSHFEEGGVIPQLSKKIDTLESHFEEGGVIPQLQGDIASILRLLRENETGSAPTKRREKSR